MKRPMMRNLREQTWAAIGVAIGALLVCSGSLHAARDPGSRQFLAQAFDLSGSDLSRLDAGHVVTKSLNADDKEVAVFGLVKVRVTPEYYVSRMADIETFKKDEAVLQIGRFDVPPRIEDVRRLTLDAAEVDGLRSCRPGDCDLQMPASFIRAFQSDVDWNSRDAAARASEVMRSQLTEYVRRYRSDGGELVEYVNDARPVSVAGELGKIVAAEPVLSQFAPLRDYLLEPRMPPPDGITRVIYWSKEKVARKAVISVTDMVAFRMPAAAPVNFAVASKQLYASHYFQASLGLTILAETSPGTRETYVGYVNRSRVDAFGGLFGGLARKIVRSRARSGMADHMTDLKARLERDFAAGGGR